MAPVRSNPRALTTKQRDGRACVYCRCTFGAMEPVEAPSELGLLFLFAHPECVERPPG